MKKLLLLSLTISYLTWSRCPTSCSIFDSPFKTFNGVHKGTCNRSNRKQATIDNRNVYHACPQVCCERTFYFQKRVPACYEKYTICRAKCPAPEVEVARKRADIIDEHYSIAPIRERYNTRITKGAPLTGTITQQDVIKKIDTMESVAPVVNTPVKNTALAEPLQTPPQTIVTSDLQPADMIV